MMRIVSALIAVLLAAALSVQAEEAAGAKWSTSANAGSKTPAAIGSAIAL